MKTHYQGESGFTLIEVLVVVVIIGILAGVALPSYSRYVERGKLTDATSELMQYRVQIEQYYQDNGKYGSATNAACGVTRAQTTYFTFACTVGNSSTDTYLATASSRAGAGLGSAAGAFTFTTNEQSARNTTAFRGTTVSKACWLIKGDEC